MVRFSHAQQIERQVIATAGSDYVTSKGGMEWTLGEVMVEGYDIGQISLSQGFHQVELLPTGIQQPPAALKGFHVFPNPVSDELTLVRNDNTNDIRITLLDASGRLCFQEDWNGLERTFGLNVRTFAAGLYVIMLFDQKNHQSVQYRIAKSINE